MSEPEEPTERTEEVMNGSPPNGTANVEEKPEKLAAEQTSAGMSSLRSSSGPRALLRVLMDLRTVGGFIGKGGESIQARTKETNTTYNIEPLLPGCDVRVIGMISNDTTTAVVQIETLAKALVALGQFISSEQQGMLTIGLLAPTSQVGQLLGRGGSRIEAIRRDSGADVRVLPRSELSPAARLSDEVVLVGGSNLDILSAALQSVGSELAGASLEGAHKGGAGVTNGGGFSARASAPTTPASVEMLTVAMVGHADASHARVLLGDTGVPAGVPVETCLTLLVPPAAVGPLVGRGGEQIERLRRTTGAFLRLQAAPPGSTALSSLHCSSFEDVATTHCAAQEAVIRAFLTISNDESGARHEARLSVPSDSVGLLLGRRGTMVSLLRAESGASIHIGAKGGQRPNEDEESSSSYSELSVVGTLPSVVAAIRSICTLLRVFYARRAVADIKERRSNSPSSHAQQRATRTQPHDSSSPSRGVQYEFVLDAVQTGAVLGKGGANIKQVREVTGAVLRLSTVDDDDARNTRRLIVRGMPDAAAAACSMVDAFLLVRGCAKLEESTVGQ